MASLVLKNTFPLRDIKIEIIKYDNQYYNRIIMMLHPYKIVHFFKLGIMSYF